MITYTKFSARLGRKLRRVEVARFPKEDRGLGGADVSSWAFVAWEGRKVLGYLLVDFDDPDVDVEVLDFAALEGSNAGLSLIRAFLRQARESGWRRIRAALRRSTWEGNAFLGRFHSYTEWENDDYRGVVIEA